MTRVMENKKYFSGITGRRIICIVSIKHCHGLTRQPATQHPTAAPHSGMGRRMEKGENSWAEIKIG